MNRLISRSQTSINVNGRTYSLNTGYRNALLTWDVFEAAHCGELSVLAAADAAIFNMLCIELADMDETDIQDALQEIADYLNKYARVSSSEHHNNKLLLDLNQDAVFLFDAFMSMGIDLESDDISYPKFMSLLRELPKDAAICRIVYLRQQIQRGKLTKEEREEVNRRGRDVIYIRDRKAKKEQVENEDYFAKLQKEMRAARGLPPL